VDFGHRFLLDYLALLDPGGSRRYACCVLTHTHHDHTACLEAFLQRYDRWVDEYWFSFVDPGDRIGLLTLRAAMIRGHRGRLLVEDGMAPIRPRLLEPDVEIVAFAPPTEAVLRPPGSGGSTAENNRSIVLLVRYGRSVILLGGDAEEERWRQIARQAQASRIGLGACLIKPPHHGATPPRGIPEQLWPMLLASPATVVAFSVGRIKDRPHLRTIEAVRARATVRCTGRSLTCRPLPGLLSVPGTDAMSNVATSAERSADLFARALLPAPETQRGPLCFGTQIYQVRSDGTILLVRARQPAFLDACVAS
jgi:hypothetical protein